MLIDFPRISIITPSYNQSRYLEPAIQSVLSQSYPNVEYIVIDGASTDGSVDIIRRHTDRLAYWVSEKDRGQSHAINKGFAKCSGEIVGWLCSDDLLLPGSLERVAESFAELGTHVVAGACEMRFEVAAENSRIVKCRSENFGLLPCMNPIWQPSCFFRRSVIQRPMPVREDLHFSMDCELWCYLKSCGAHWRFVDEALSVYRVTGQNKSHTGGERIMAEIEEIYREYVRERVPLTMWERKAWLPFAQAYRRNPRSVTGMAARAVAKAISMALRGFYGWERVAAMEGQYVMYAINQEIRE